MAQHLGAETVEPRRRANDPVVAAVAMQGLAHDVEAHAVRLARDEEVVPRMPAAEVWQVGAPATPDVAAGHTHPQPVGGAARLACPQGRVPQHSEGGRGGSAGGVRTLHANNSRCKFAYVGRLQNGTQFPINQHVSRFYVSTHRHSETHEACAAGSKRAGFGKRRRLTR